MVTVRPAALADAADVVRINVRTWRHAYAGIVPDDVLAALDQQLDERVRRTRDRWAEPAAPVRTVVAVPGPNQPPIGYASYGPYRDGRDWAELDPAVGELLAIYVDPPHQRAGAGRALLDVAVGALRRAGAGEIRLWVLAGNAPARRFYERSGFVADGALDTFRMERPDGTPVDLLEVRYAIRLPAGADPAAGRCRPGSGPTRPVTGRLTAPGAGG